VLLSLITSVRAGRHMTAGLRGAADDRHVDTCHASVLLTCAGGGCPCGPERKLSEPASRHPGASIVSRVGVEDRGGVAEGWPASQPLQCREGQGGARSLLLSTCQGNMTVESIAVDGRARGTLEKFSNSRCCRLFLAQRGSTVS
ncbi:hypothetical protein BaRGS_00020622, partial [Batillaria attramentaria]